MHVGVDIGATWTRVRCVAGDRPSSLRFSTPKLVLPADCDLFLTALVRKIRRAAQEAESASSPGRVRAIALAVPGLIDADAGIVKRCVNLRGLEDFSLASAISSELGCDAFLMTDAEAATRGEYGALEPRPARFVHLRLGTGVACGIIINGDYQPLDEPRMTHAPTLVVDRFPEALPCECGLSGCLEVLASGKAIKKMARDLFDYSVSRLEEAWDKEETGPRTVMEQTGEFIATALRNLDEKFSPDVIILGGGVIEHLSRLWEPIMENCRQGDLEDRIKPARLGDDAGAIGAAEAAARRAASVTS